MRIRSQMSIQAITASALVAACGVALATPDQAGVSAQPAAGQATQSGPSARSFTQARLASGEMSVLVQDSQATVSEAQIMHGENAGARVIIRNIVLVKTDQPDALRAAVVRLAGGSDLHVGDAAVGGGGYWAVRAPDVGRAIETADRLSVLSFVESATVDSSRPRLFTADRVATQRAVLERAAFLEAAPGIALPMSSSARGGVDPQVPFQWHLTNVFLPGRDNNLGPVFASGVTGAGVTVSISNIDERRFDEDHQDLVDRFAPTLSDAINPFLPRDEFDTHYAGLIGATAGNGLNGQGVAPGVRLAGLQRGTPLFEERAFVDKNIGVRYHPMRLSLLPFDSYDYSFPDDSYYDGFSEFVYDSLLNSLAFGRGRLGTVHVFSTGSGSTFPLAPAYGGGGWAQMLEGNVVGVTATNGYLVGPNMYGAMPHYYPPAAHRDTLVINTIAEDGEVDIFGSRGPNVFASVYGATSQTTLIGAPARLTQSTLPDDAFGEVEEDPALGQFGGNNATGGAIATGIIALMLEVNPNLKVRDIQHILVRASTVTGLDFDPSEEYFRYVNTGLYINGDAVPSHWETNAAFIRHSDEYGFGAIDAEAAVNLARTWTNVPRAIGLNTGLVAPEEELTIPDAEYQEIDEENSVAVQNNPPVIIPLCIRENISIESIEVELSITGEGSNDLLIWIESPNGTVSNLHYPTSYSASGMTDPDNPEYTPIDTAFAGVTIGGDAYAFYKHQFITYKHWGEPSGGRWQMFIIDLGPDDDLTEGTEETDTEPAVDHVTAFPPLFVPGNPAREEKAVVEYRIRIIGTETGDAPFLGCDPIETSCPGDLNANGVVSAEDLAIFISWYIQGNLLADINSDGVVTFADLLAFQALWQPGNCAPSGLPFGRPSSAQPTPNTPVLRPV